MSYQPVLRRLIPQVAQDPDSQMWRYRCPNPACPCSEPDEHRHLYLDTEVGMGYCFRCRKGMGLVRFLSLYLGIPRDYAQFYAYGDREMVVRVSGRVEEDAMRKGKGKLKMGDQSIIPGMQLPQHTKPAVSHPYLKKRRISDESRDFRKGI